MPGKKRRNVYDHGLRIKQGAFAAAAVYAGFPAVMAACIGLSPCNMKQPAEPGYAPLEQAAQVLDNCSPRTEDLNGNGMLETVCDDADGRHYEVRYGPNSEIVLELYACDVDLTKPYERCR